MDKKRDISELYADVIKNISASFECRKLVYIILVEYSDRLPDIALLSVNSLQKGTVNLYKIRFE